MINDKKIRRMNSFDNNLMIPETDDPRTLLIPISLVLLSARNEVSPVSPKLAIKIVRNVRIKDNIPKFASFL